MGVSRWICLGFCALRAFPAPAQVASEAGELSRRLSLHSAIFVQHDRLGKPLTVMQPDADGVVRFTVDFINDYASNPSMQGLSSEEQSAAELVRFVQAKPVILMARAVSHRSAFTPSKGFIYSDWDFEVDRIFRNSSPEATAPGSVITVTRPGGALVEKQIRYVAEDKTFPDFQDGNTYFLFLQPLTDGTHSFRVFAGDAFLISGSSVIRIDDYQRHSALSNRLHLTGPDAFASSIEEIVRHAAQ
jgi:hypothetical protein